MAMADVPDEEALTAEHPRLTLLREFLDRFYAPGDPRMAKIDGHMLARAWAPYCAEHEIPVQPTTRLYGDLRYFGFVVRPGTSNRMTVYGIKEKPHVRSELERLEAGWSEVAATAAEQKYESRAVTLAREAMRDTMVIPQEVINEALLTTIDIMRNCPDAGRRLQASEMILSRGIQKVPTRIIEEAKEVEEVIEVEVVDRMSLDEVEAAVRKLSRPAE